MYFVRIVALLIAAFLFYAAYMSPTEAVAFTGGGLFFVLMTFLSFKNSGAVDGPYIYFGFSAVMLFCSFKGLMSGIFGTPSFQIKLQENPLGFWSLFSIYGLLSIGCFIYALTKLRKQSHS